MLMPLMISCENLNQNLKELFSRDNVTVVGDFCSYQKVIREKGDSNIQARLSVKQRILVNEARYACECEKRQDICAKLPREN